MDWKSLLEKKLFEPDKCLVGVLGKLVGSTGKPLRLVSLIEGQGEYAVFLYSIGKIPTKNPDDINLENSLPINTSFQFNLVSQSTGVNPVLPVRFRTSMENILVELPQGPELTTLFQQLKQAKQVQSQNAGFGLPSTFGWIEKYTGVPSTPVLFGSEIQDDIFDPFAVVTPVSSVSNSKTNSYPAVHNHSNFQDTSSSISKTKQRHTDLDWQKMLLTQPDVGEQCPVVKDNSVVSGNMMTHSRSEKDFKSTSRTDFFKQVSTDIGAPIKKKSEFHDNNDVTDVAEMLQKNPSDGSRDKIIKLLMSMKQEQYTDIKFFRVFCGTWNTNGQNASEPVNEWLSPQGDEPPHMYAIGFQELDLSKNAFIFSESPKEDEWFQRVKAGLHPGAKYQRLKLIRLVGMMLVVFAQEKLCDHIYNLEAEQVGTGLMGMMGNKGGVAVRFELHDSSICFVNSHLAAHMEEYERRNQDFREINNRMTFVIKNTFDSVMISDHDIVFWLGDLNYRLSDISHDNCLNMIAKKQLHELMNYDQLNRQMSLKHVFLDYLEGRINFIPTYKYDPGTDKFDSSEKNRMPAWCDRILWKGRNVSQQCYRSHPQLKLSDHKPVSAIFKVGINVINKEKYKETYKEVMQELDRRENEFLPQVHLDTMELKFENVKFFESQTQNVTVKNTGQVPVEFEFIKKLEDPQYCKPWLTAEPYKSVINIGESCTIQFEVHVNSVTASKLNCSDDKIEDILVLHLEGGKDLFISVSGSYMSSCFGSSIEALINMFKPIRDVETAVLIDLEHSSPSSPQYPGVKRTDRPLDIPKELYRMVDHLVTYGKETEDLFQQQGLQSEIQLIRDCLDTGIPSVLPGTTHSVAQALLLFLDSLAEPVIPRVVYQQCLDSCNSYDHSRQVLLQVPVCHKTVFKYLCAFCRHLLLFNMKNNLNAKFLANLFGNLFLQPPLNKASKLNSSQRKLEEQKRSAFVYNFLANEYDE